MDACPQCGTSYGIRRRCYKCTGRQKDGTWITCEREGCGRQRYVQQNQLTHEACRFCSNRCKKLAMKGQPFLGKPHYETVPIGHRRERSDGYIEVKVGREASPNGFELEHRLIMALLLGRKLERHEEVHHHDRDRSHNCPGNLEVSHNGEHQKLHHKLYPQLSTKLSVSCAWIGCDQVKRVVPSRLKTYQHIYCSNEHRLAAMHQKAREYHAKKRAIKG